MNQKTEKTIREKTRFKIAGELNKLPLGTIDWKPIHPTVVRMICTLAEDIDTQADRIDAQAAEIAELRKEANLFDEFLAPRIAFVERLMIAQQQQQQPTPEAEKVDMVHTSNAAIIIRNEMKRAEKAEQKLAAMTKERDIHQDNSERRGELIFSMYIAADGPRQNVKGDELKAVKALRADRDRLAAENDRLKIQHDTDTERLVECLALIEAQGTKLADLKSSKSDAVQQARNAFAEQIKYIYAKTSDAIRTGQMLDKADRSIIRAFDAIIPFIKPTVKETSTVQVHESATYIHPTQPAAPAAVCDVCHGEGSYNYPGAGWIGCTCKDAPAATPSEPTEEYFIDRDYGDLWKGPIKSTDNLHYAKLSGVCEVDCSLIWVLYASDRDPKWIPASHEVVEQTIQNALKSYYTTQLAERDKRIAELTPLADAMGWLEKECMLIRWDCMNKRHIVSCVDGTFYGTTILEAIAAARAGK